MRVEGGSALGEEDPGRAAGVLEEADKHGGVDLGGGRTRGPTEERSPDAAAAGAPTEERSPEEEARWRRRWANRLDGEEEKEAMAMCVEVKRRVRRGLMAATVITAPRWRYRGGVGGVAAVRRPNSQGL